MCLKAVYSVCFMFLENFRVRFEGFVVFASEVFGVCWWFYGAFRVFFVQGF